jgi:WD40-like Beta Propeller Repeat
MRIFIILSILLFASRVFAQLPETRIYTLDIEKEGRNKYVFSNPKLISKQKGYNNQPYFTDDDRYILYASNNGKGNTDIYRYDMKRDKNKRITKTDEAEYSPRESMQEEGEITCVRVEKDTVTQHFYAYNAAGKKGHLLLPDVTSLGYYTWLNGAEIIGLTLPEPFTLTKYNTITLKADTLTTHIGRTFQMHNSKLYFVDKSDTNNMKICIMPKENIRPRKNAAKVENIIVCSTLDGQEDFCVTYDGTIWMGKEGKLFAFYTKKIKGIADHEWIEIADFTKLGIASFYRLAINQSTTKIAVVMYAGAKP